MACQPLAPPVEKVGRHPRVSPPRGAGSPWGDRYGLEVTTILTQGVHGIHNGFELRKLKTGYNGVLEAENGNIAPEKA